MPENDTELENEITSALHAMRLPNVNLQLYVFHSHSYPLESVRLFSPLLYQECLSKCI